MGQTNPVLIHTSCSSKSSYIILVILDKYDTWHRPYQYTLETIGEDTNYLSVENGVNIIDWQWQTHISHTDTSYNAVGTIASKNIIYKNTTSGTIDCRSDKPSPDTRLL